MWNAESYLAFGDHRARPFHDLLARVGATDARRVVDLGCGPGTLTGLLSRRWPRARVEAYDSSPEMVESARARGVPATLLDVRDWQPAPDTDVVVCNAVLQWVRDHGELLRQWVVMLPAGAWLAVQVPANFAAPSHVLVRELAAEPRWRNRIDPLREDRVLDPVGYARLLAATVAEVDVWETTYLHPLTGEDPVLEWISGTALRPVRAALSDDEWLAFRAELAPRLQLAYTTDADGVTWFPFRRIFAVARTAG